MLGVAAIVAPLACAPRRDEQRPLHAPLVAAFGIVTLACVDAGPTHGSTDNLVDSDRHFYISRVLLASLVILEINATPPRRRLYHLWKCRRSASQPTACSRAGVGPRTFCGRRAAASETRCAALDSGRAGWCSDSLVLIWLGGKVYSISAVSLSLVLNGRINSARVTPEFPNLKTLHDPDRILTPGVRMF